MSRSSKSRNRRSIKSVRRSLATFDEDRDTAGGREDNYAAADHGEHAESITSAEPQGVIIAGPVPVTTEEPEQGPGQAPVVTTEFAEIATAADAITQRAATTPVTAAPDQAYEVTENPPVTAEAPIRLASTHQAATEPAPEAAVAIETLAVPAVAAGEGLLAAATDREEIHPDDLDPLQEPIFSAVSVASQPVIRFPDSKVETPPDEQTRRILGRLAERCAGHLRTVRRRAYLLGKDVSRAVKIYSHGDGLSALAERMSADFSLSTTPQALGQARTVYLAYSRDEYETSRPPEEYFECVTPNALEADRSAPEKPGATVEWTIDFTGQPADRAAALTFEFDEQIVGWPRFTIDAPAGTTVELMVQEAHAVGGPPLLNMHYHFWSRFICREGTNEFETLDFESCRWVQLHIRNARGVVRLRGIGVCRRVFPWPNTPTVRVAEPELQRLFDATLNTLHNCAQETCVDGMARERQQYSGDGAHQLHAISLAFGETRLPARYLRTFSQGMSRDGWFFDTWPAYDRLCRVMCREINLAGFGPILDHGIGFNFDCFYQYL